ARCAPAGSVVPFGTTNAFITLEPVIVKPERSASDRPAWYTSTQSCSADTSLSTTIEVSGRFALPFVGATVLKGPLPFGTRPPVVPASACPATQDVPSTSTFARSKRCTASPEVPTPKLNCP